MEVHGRTDTHPAVPGRPHARADRYALTEAAAHGQPVLEGAVDGNCLPLKGAHIVAGFLAVFVTCGRPMVEQCIPEGLYPMEKTHAGAVLQEFSLWEGPILKKFMKSCLLWEGPHTGEREECNYEGASEASVMNPHFPSLCTFRWAEAEELNVKLSLLRGV